MSFKTNRRQFMGSVAATTAAFSVPNIVTAQKTDAKEIVTGAGDHKFRVKHGWAKLPDKFKWQTTHNVAVDSANNLYVIHEGKRNQKNHPSIFVFDPKGKFIRAFGSQFQGGGHGIEVRKEGEQEYLYVAAYQQVKAIAKLTLTGETVWFQKAPMESGFYAEGEDVSTEPTWNRKGFLPTNFAFLDDGGFLLADGYGSYQIHRYDKNAKWVSSFGGPGEGKGKFATAHGVWIDQRDGREKSIVVTDRAHHTLQYFSMDGKYLETIEGFGLPANIDTWKDLMVVPELRARLTLLDYKNNVVAHLGDGVKRLEDVKDLRNKPKEWKDGEFVHPHDARFDAEGNIFVAEWVGTGRITKLERIK